MPYEEIGFRHRGGGGGGGGGGRYGGGGGGRGGDENTIEAEEILGEEIVGVETIDGDDYDVIDQDIGIDLVELDYSGAPTGRRRRLGRKVKRIMRRRQQLHNKWARQDARLAHRQNDAERHGHMAHQKMPWQHHDGGGGCPGGAKEVAAPLATSTSLAAAASGTLTLTPQFLCEIDKVVMSASAGQLQAVLITNILFGVTPLYSNPEATSGWLADTFAQNGTLGDFLKGKQLIPQTPVKFSITNNHTATQTVSVFVKTNTIAAAFSSAAS